MTDKPNYNHSLIFPEVIKSEAFKDYWYSLQLKKNGSGGFHRRNPHLCNGGSSVPFKPFGTYMTSDNEKYINPEIFNGEPLDPELKKIHRNLIKKKEENRKITNEFLINSYKDL